MSAPRYRVWDLPVRLFHWGIVALVALQWASGAFRLLDMRWHFALGYATLALLVFRLLWGLVGSDNARFARFVRGPAAVARYVLDARARAPHRQVGHNPLGGWSVLAMLFALAFETTTGLFASDDVDATGPLGASVPLAWARRLSRWHATSRWALLVLIVLHVGGVLYHHASMRDDLIGPMLSGRKALPEDPRLRFASNARALALLAIVVAGVALALLL